MWCIEQAHMQAHKTTHVSWLEGERHRHLQQASVWEPQVVCLTLRAQWPHEGKTHVYGSRPWPAMIALVRTVPSKLNPQHFATHIWLPCIFLTQIRQAGEARGCSQNRFIQLWEWSWFVQRTQISAGTHASILSSALSPPSPPSVSICPPPPTPVVRNPLPTAPAVCLLFMSNVPVAGSPRKAASIDWKTIQFSLARLAARCGLDLCFVAWLCGVKAAATWPTVMVSKTHPTQADEGSVHWPNCSWCTSPWQCKSRNEIWWIWARICFFKFWSPFANPVKIHDRKSFITVFGICIWLDLRAKIKAFKARSLLKQCKKLQYRLSDDSDGWRKIDFPDIQCSPVVLLLVPKRMRLQVQSKYGILCWMAGLTLRVRMKSSGIQTE